jgi:membrane-associated phospholipid phosphatase
MIGLVAGLIALTIRAREAGPLPGDVGLTRSIQTAGSAGLDRAARVVSGAGAPLGLALLAGAIVAGLALRRRFREAALVVATGLAEIGTGLLRLMSERPRPGEGLVRVAESGPGTSFPSGHAADAAALGVLLGHLVANWPAPTRVLAWTGLGTFVLAQGVTRVYLGAHWPSDVLGGYLLGAALGLGLGSLSRASR